MRERLCVALVMAAVVSLGVAGPAAADTAMVWPVKFDVSGMDRFLLYMTNICQRNVYGVAVTLVEGGPSVWIDGVSVYLVPAEADISSDILYRNTNVSTRVIAATADAAIEPGQRFVVEVLFTSGAGNGAYVMVAPGIYRNSYFYPMAIPVQ